MTLKKLVRKIFMLFKTKNMVPIINAVPTEKLLQGKIALIVGGSGGIGMAIAKMFYAAGANIIITGTNEEKLKRCCLEVGDEQRCKHHVLDIREANEIGSGIKTIIGLFPEQRIDILVNCAGVVNDGDFWSISEDVYDRVMDINVKGVYFVSKEVSKYMIEKKIRGHILNVSSSSALRPAWTPYQISKWAIRGFTKGLADTLLPYGIIVNAIGPGQTATDMLGIQKNDTIYNPTNPCGRYVTPEEVANLALLLVSGTGDMIIGETFYITGGSGTISMHR